MGQIVLTSKSSLLLLLVSIPGVLLQRQESSSHPPLRPAEAQIYQPALQPSESIPPIGTYMLRNQAGEPCVKVTLGVEYIVVEKMKSWYFSMDPTRVGTSGYCTNNLAVLSLMLPHSSAGLQFTFMKEKKTFYVQQLEAHISPQPICEKCANKTYVGLLAQKKLFVTSDGQSFKCASETLLVLSPQLKIKLVPLQMQAFSLPRGAYGTELECWADYNKRVIPIVIGAVVVGLLLIAMLTFLFIKDRRTQDYERL
ncbi:lysosome-associated membrane glycoprotein 3 [Salarias fasciatus]|uniref:Lysosome-associated membrane glycoprotein 2-like luminal domain-containing protein n=1 Tax=Salarias fasciatus TaxID=181472 RepID=A0A672I7B1_SALFA|nr:lysosome-associated membrane glycoprotein 3 [Salarias fasciatus]